MRAAASSQMTVLKGCVGGGQQLLGRAPRSTDPEHRRGTRISESCYEGNDGGGQSPHYIAFGGEWGVQIDKQASSNLDDEQMLPCF